MTTEIIKRIEDQMRRQGFTEEEMKITAQNLAVMDIICATNLDYFFNAVTKCVDVMEDEALDKTLEKINTTVEELWQTGDEMSLLEWNMFLHGVVSGLGAKIIEAREAQKELKAHTKLYKSIMAQIDEELGDADTSER